MINQELKDDKKKRKTSIEREKERKGESVIRGKKLKIKR